ncbi:MAG: hypothetical protein IJT16_00030 [Lachnospiraceae bacterium]|nr:hypothetical protein [Lachnospiraceae bacterium]
MAEIRNISTQSVNEYGDLKLNFRTIGDMKAFCRYVLRGNQTERPLFSLSRGFISSTDNPDEISSEMQSIQELYRKTKGIRIRGEIAVIEKEKLGEDKLSEIKDIAFAFAGYYMDRGYQTAYGIYDAKDCFEIRYAINTVSYADGAKYRHNNADIYEQEEQSLNTVVADVRGLDIPDEERFDFETLEYHQ